VLGSGCADTHTHICPRSTKRGCAEAGYLLILLPLNSDAAVPVLQTAGAPLRTVTVRDTIGDLPPVENGEDREEMPYGGELAINVPRTCQGVPSPRAALQESS